ncbi:MAG: TldD/PmbA family protein [Bryobacteraceae bacterium]|jgi:predicted Zn-dependent protease
MAESELLTRVDCQEIFDRALRAARALGADDVEVTLGAADSALTRFANSAIHQNVSERRRFLSVRTVVGHRTARASTNRLDDDSVRAVVEEALAITRSAESDPELLPMAEPGEVRDTGRFFPSTARSTPRDRAEMVARAIGVAEGASQTAAGICSAGQSVMAILNSRGVFAYYFDTLAQFSITTMTEDGSGWAKASAPDSSQVDPVALAKRASEKAALSRRPRELAPGRYTVILEPSAVQDLLGQMFFDFSATAIHDQRSFLTGRIGKPVFGAGIQIADDVYHPLQSGPPFDGEGVPRRPLALVENGVPREVACSRQAAQREGCAPTGHGFPLPNESGEAPMNIVMQGGGQTLERMIAGSSRGILVTRLWYIREVDPYEKIMTGMTRDGTFLIEDGCLVCGVRNFRFNQSLIELLRNVEALSPSERAAGEESFDMVAPALKVGDFHFSEVTRF